METSKQIYTKIEAYVENIDFRDRMVMDVSISVKIMLYPKYILVNKTNFDMMYQDDYEILKQTNDFLMSNLDENKL